MFKRLAAAMLTIAAFTVLAAKVEAQQMFSQGYTFLKAVEERDGSAVEGILGNPGSTIINTRSRDRGETALHYVVKGRDMVWTQYLLGHGARTNIADNDGITPLAIAAHLGWAEGVRLLVRAGADVNARNKRGETPLILAVHNRDLAMVRLLMANRADPNLSDSVAGYSALDYARRDNRGAAILRILEAPPAPAAAAPTP